MGARLPTAFAHPQARDLSIANPANRSVTHDAWMITPAAVGDGLASDAYMDLSQLVLYGARTTLFCCGLKLQRPQ